MSEDTWGRRANAPKSLPMCERCGVVRANTSLNFSYRDEEYAVHYYCEPCCDLAWEEGKAYVDAKAAALAKAKEEGRWS